MKFGNVVLSQTMISRRDALRLAAGTAVVGTSLSVPAVSASGGNWEKPRYDAGNTGNAPEGPGFRASESWSSGADVVGTPIVADGTVYVAGAQGTVRALDAEDGVSVWKFETDGRITSSASYHDGTVYVTADTVTYALDADEGTVRWKQTGTGLTGSAANTDGNRVYVGKSSRLYALGMHTGTVLWRYGASGAVSATPAVSEDTVYIADESGELHAIDAEDGFFRWRKGAAASVKSAPVVTRNRVYVVGTRGKVRSFDKSDGDIRWTEELFERIRYPPAVDGDHIYVGTEKGVYALRTSSGWVDWSFETEDAATAPSVGGNTVYVGDGSTVYALDTGTGKVNWRSEIPGATSPAVTSDTLYFGTNFGVRAVREERRLPDIDIADISVDPTEVKVDGTVNITVELENTGEADGTFLVTLYVDASAVDSEEMTVPSGETREIGFTVSFEEPGERYLRVNTENAGTVTVIADETGLETETEAETTENEVDEDAEGNTTSSPADFGATAAVTITVTALSVTVAVVALKIARWRAKIGTEDGIGMSDEDS